MTLSPTTPHFGNHGGARDGKGGEVSLAGKNSGNAPAPVRRCVLVYRELLLPASETFIAGQAHALKRYRHMFAGLEYRPNSLISRDESIVAHRGPFKAFSRALHRRRNSFPAAFVSALEAQHPDILHAHFGIDGIASMRLASVLQVPHIVTFHGYDATVRDEHLMAGPYVQRRFAHRRDSLARSGASFLAVSNFIRDQLLQRGFSSESVRVHYTGIDTALFSPPAIVERNPHILFVARLVAKKGVGELIEAARALQPDIPNLVVSVVGDGPERSRLEAAARELPSIRVLGYRTPAEIRQLMIEARVFCVPSVTGPNGDAEGFGIVFAEAQAMGVPVVSYRSGGIPEAVDDGCTGFLAPEGDILSLVRHLRSLLLMEHSTWREYSARAVDRVHRLFNLDTQSMLLEQIYDSVCEEYRK